MEVVNVADKLKLFSDHWNPRVVAALNGQQVKLVKFEGEFTWHHHAEEDELFYVLAGEFTMRLRPEQGGDRRVRAGEFIVIPRGVEHCPYAEKEVHVILLEPKGTLNTGNVVEARTRQTLERL
jgi:mannose-6-phosphate isomerase-like protein (cupin superfamily)